MYYDPMYAYTDIILMYSIFQRQIHFILTHRCLVSFAIQHLLINTIFTYIAYFPLIKPNGLVFVNLKLIIVIVS